MGDNCLGICDVRKYESITEVRFRKLGLWCGFSQLCSGCCICNLFDCVQPIFNLLDVQYSPVGDHMDGLSSPDIPVPRLRRAVCDLMLHFQSCSTGMYFEYCSDSYYWYFARMVSCTASARAALGTRVVHSCIRTRVGTMVDCHNSFILCYGLCQSLSCPVVL